MNDNYTNIKNASFLVYGASLFTILANTIMWRFASGYASPIPGFHYVPGIAWGMMFFWGGLLLRTVWPKAKWWILVPVLLIALFFLYRYIQAQTWLTTSIPNLYTSLFCFGFIVPLETIKTAEKYNGWYLLVLLLTITFSYVAASVANDRLYWHNGALPQFEDMWKLLLGLMAATVPLLNIAAVHLAAIFAFTKTGQCLGNQKWLKWAVIILGVQVYLRCLVNLIGWRNDWYFTSMFIIQPINVYLCIALYRRIELRHEDGSKLTWKECFKIRFKNEE